MIRTSGKPGDVSAMSITLSTKEITMIDRANAEAATYRVAVAALTYRPDKTMVEPGYTIDEDVDWCIQPLHGIPAESIDQVRVLVRDTIIDPTAHRMSLARVLADLTGEREE